MCGWMMFCFSLLVWLVAGSRVQVGAASSLQIKFWCILKQSHAGKREETEDDEAHDLTTNNT